MEVKEYTLRVCKNCNTEVPRAKDGDFPSGKGARFVDVFGHLWNGKICPSCVRIINLARYHRKQQEKQSQEQSV
jgi:hypothetical protein